MVGLPGETLVQARRPDLCLQRRTGQPAPRESVKGQANENAPSERRGLRVSGGQLPGGGDSLAARLVPSKGLECLLQTAALLAGRGLPIRLDLIGKERVPGYRASLERLARSLGIGNCVEFSGWIPFDRLQEKYLQSDIQVISSLAEGTPRVILEGAARGQPLVSTNVGGIPDVVKDGYDAVLVPPGDPTSLADAIERVIKDGLLCRRLVEGGYRSAREASFERAGMQFLADLQSLVSDAS